MVVRDPHELRALFRNLRCVERALQDHYTGCRDRANVNVIELPGTGAAYSLLIRFDDGLGFGRFSVHCYLDGDWRIVSRGGRLLDPKMVIDDDGIMWALVTEKPG